MKSTTVKRSSLKGGAGAVGGGTQLDSQRNQVSTRGVTVTEEPPPGWIGERTPPASKRESGPHHAKFADTVAPRVVARDRLDSVNELGGVSTKGNPLES